MRELLANCLREEANGYVVSSLVNEFPTLPDLINAEEQELRNIKGIGAVKAKQLRAILDFVRAAHMPVTDKRVIIRSPSDVYETMKANLEFLQQEEFWVIGLNTKNQVVFKENISMGTLNASLVHPREVYKRLIKRACASCILVHNHPSGDPTPSHEDIDLTRKLVEAGKLLDMAVLDHVIVGMGKYVSFKEKGLI